MSNKNKEYIKKSIPIIVILDVLVLLLFAYISMPHKNKEISFFIDFDSRIMDGAFVEVISKGSSKYYLIKNNKLKDNPTNNPINSWYAGFKCSLGSSCSKILGFEQRGDLDEYHIIFPDDKVMTPAFALWHNYCEQEKCNGGIYINASNGKVFICNSDGFLKGYDEINGKVSSLSKCEFKIKR